MNDSVEAAAVAAEVNGAEGADTRLPLMLTTKNKGWASRMCFAFVLASYERLGEKSGRSQPVADFHARYEKRVNEMISVPEGTDAAMGVADELMGMLRAVVDKVKAIDPQVAAEGVTKVNACLTKHTRDHAVKQERDKHDTAHAQARRDARTATMQQEREGAGKGIGR